MATIEFPFKHALVHMDQEDFDKFGKIHWCIIGEPSRRYVRAKAGPDYLHRLIVSKVLGRLLTRLDRVTFKDGNGLNCQRDNLLLNGEPIC